VVGTFPRQDSWICLGPSPNLAEADPSRIFSHPSTDFESQPQIWSISRVMAIRPPAELPISIRLSENLTKSTAPTKNAPAEAEQSIYQTRGLPAKSSATQFWLKIRKTLARFHSVCLGEGHFGQRALAARRYSSCSRLCQKLTMLSAEAELPELRSRTWAAPNRRCQKLTTSYCTKCSPC
jgi:hypothetical protein